MMLVSRTVLNRRNSWRQATLSHDRCARAEGATATRLLAQKQVCKTLDGHFETVLSSERSCFFNDHAMSAPMKLDYRFSSAKPLPTASRTNISFL